MKTTSNLLLTIVLFALAANSAESSFCDSDTDFEQVFSDEFDTFNESTWSKTVGNEIGQLRDAYGSATHSFIEDGKLVLLSTADPATWKGLNYSYTSASVTTKGKRSWKRARVCVSASLPGGGGAHAGDGIWPAHWLLPDVNSCWPDLGEIDIMEMINGDGSWHGTYHWNPAYPSKNCTSGNGQQGTQLALEKGWDSSFVEYATEWGDDYVAFFVNGKLIHNVTSLVESKRKAEQQMPLHYLSSSTALADGEQSDDGADTPKIYGDTPFYLILNTAITNKKGEWPRPVSPNTVFPTRHVVDYVKVATRRR